MDGPGSDPAPKEMYCMACSIHCMRRGSTIAEAVVAAAWERSTNFNTSFAHWTLFPRSSEDTTNSLIALRSF